MDWERILRFLVRECHLSLDEILDMPPQMLKIVLSDPDKEETKLQSHNEVLWWNRMYRERRENAIENMACGRRWDDSGKG